MKRAAAFLISLSIALGSLTPVARAATPQQCESLVAFRDDDLLQMYDATIKDYEKFQKQYEVYHKIWSEFKEQNAESNLVVIKGLDALLTAAQVTADVVSGLVPAKMAVVHAVDAVPAASEVVVEMLEGFATQPVKDWRDLGKRMIVGATKQGPALIKAAGGIFKAVDTALEAKERSDDRNDTLRIVRDVGRDLEQKLQTFEASYQAAIDELDMVNRLRAEIDALCSGGFSPYASYAVCWQNKHGYWFCDGPVQRTSVGEEDQAKALDYAGCENGKEAGQVDKGLVFRCPREPRSYDRDIREKYDL